MEPNVDAERQSRHGCAMTDSPLPTGVWRFGRFEADLDAEELRKNGMKIHLQGQPFHVLSVLLTHAGRLVRREELRREVWPEDTFVEFDHALNTAVKKIRFALGDAAGAPRYVETISRRGYRFIGDVHAPAVAIPKLDTQKFEPADHHDGALPAWKRTGKILAAVAAIILAAFQLTHSLRAAQGRNSKPIVVAVLPFESWSPNSELAHLSDGVSQELITQFGRIDPARLSVAARAAVQPYRQTSKTVTELGRELHADYLMQGNLRGDGQRVRVSAELVRVSDQARVWGDDFDLAGDDVLMLETNLAKSISTNVKAIILAPSS
jgi:TolB-like protein/DNA-binding winged helix-turn-helix (wHTH) protein